MSTLPSWQSITLLIVLLLAARFLAWRVWRLLAYTSTRLAPRARYLAGPRRPRDYLAQRWPRGYQWLAGRFAGDRFVGLPLTLMTLLAVYLAFLFGGLVQELFDDNDIKQIDQQFDALAQLLRGDLTLRIFGFITSLGNVETLVAVTLVTMGFLWAHARRHYIPGLLLSIVGSQTITYIGKYAIARDRPDFITFASASTPSFPSAHATGAIAVYGFIIYAIARDLSGDKRRFELAYWGSVLILSIAASRVILSVHYASDIFAGLLVGGFWLISGFALTEYLRERARHS